MFEEYKKEIFTALDLELNKNETKNKIIEIGYVIGNICSGEILFKNSILVNPNETLHPEITKLTHIKQEEVDSAKNLLAAHMQMKSDIDRYNSKKMLCNPITWGGGDSLDLKNQLKEEYPNEDIEKIWCFGRRWIDTKTVFIAHRLSQGRPFVGGLSRAMAKYGLLYKGHAHRAADDAENTFLFFKFLIDLMPKDGFKKQ